MLKIENFHLQILGENTNSRIVFVHGMMAFAANWRKIALAFQSQYQCLIYDQRGHGKSFKPEQGYTPEDFAHDLNFITDSLGWDSFHLVGHSMGGRNAIVFTDLFPHKVKTLTIEDMGPEQDPQMPTYYRNMLNAIPTPFENKSEMKNFFDHRFAQVFQASEPHLLGAFLQTNMEEKQNGTYDWKFKKENIFEIVEEGHRRSRWPEIERLTVPTLLIRGENSHVLSQKTYDEMIKRQPLIQGVVFNQTGHWIHFEKSGEFISVLTEFLKNNES